MTNQRATSLDWNTVLAHSHNAKGDSRSLGFQNLSQLWHEAETIYVTLESSEIAKTTGSDLSHIHRNIGQEISEIATLVDRIYGKQSPLIVSEEEFAWLDRHTEDFPLAISQKLKTYLDLVPKTLKESIANALIGLEKSGELLDKPLPIVNFLKDEAFIPVQWGDVFNKVFGHLFNNPLDHSIENELERKTKGKSSRGSITIEVVMSDKLVELYFHDDGRGLDINKITKKAETKGIEFNSEDLDSVCELIWKNEFSTADTLTEISGRGVGMSAAKGLLESLGAKIAVEPIGTPDTD